MTLPRALLGTKGSVVHWTGQSAVQEGLASLPDISPHSRRPWAGIPENQQETFRGAFIWQSNGVLRMLTSSVFKLLQVRKEDIRQHQPTNKN